MAKVITAKAQLGSKIQYPHQQNTVDADGNRIAENEMWYLNWYPDYADGANKEWALASPSLQYQMVVRGDVADLFKQNGHYTVSFRLDDEEEVEEVDGADNPA